nr:phospholipid carrier-dependent glycosyltransferase [uncultured Roseateles sp.]
MNVPTTAGARGDGLNRGWIAVLVLCLVVRLLTLPTIPLTDHTEARYAEIARLMLTLSDWVNPHITPDEVFWAKPPLSTWGQALSMALLGVNEWAARLPAWLWSLSSLAALAWMLRRSLEARERLVALVLLSLCPLFFVSAGAVMTDATLGATVLWVQAAWWRASRPGERSTGPGRVLAVALALALLTKGPAAAVLALLPVLAHAAWRGHGAALRRVLRDPWAWLLVLGLAVPWYVVAEWRSPGFLSYFLLGEHVMRFIDPGWKGDRYGFAHEQALGMVWLFALLAALPAVLAAAVAGLSLWRRQGLRALPERVRRVLGDDLAAYALCVALAPLLLFSASRNLIWTYAMTALPGLVLLGIGLPDLRRRTWAWGSAVVVVVYALLFSIWLPRAGEAHSDRALWQAYARDCGARACSLHYDDKPPYSAYFYSAGALYLAQADAPGSQRYAVRSHGQAGGDPRQALACNLEHCLFRDNPVQP